MIFRSRPTELLVCIAFCMAIAADGGSADAAPEEQSDVYERHMSLGIRLYEDRNFEAAMIEFERAYDARRSAGPLINMALCDKGRLEYVRAARTLERARKEPNASPEQLTAIDKATAELRELIAVVELRLHVPGDGARLEVDGEILPSGAERGPLELSPGRHLIALHLDGYDDWRTELRVGAGDRSSIEVKLTPNVGDLVIASGKNRVEIVVDGEGRPGKSRVTLRAGTHLVVVRRGADRYSFSVAIVATHETRVTLDDGGFLRIDDGAPRGPDRIDLPPLVGVYLRGTGDVGVRLSGRSPFFVVGTDLALGYRIVTGVGVEGHLRQLFTDGGVVAPNAITQGYAGVRFMTRPHPVAFEMLLAAGLTYEVPLLGQSGFAGFLACASPELAGKVGHTLLGIGTPVTFTDSAYGPSVDVALRLQAGYAQW